MTKNIWIMNHYATDMYKNRGGRHFWFAKYLKAQGYNPVIICANTFHNSKEFIEISNKGYSVHLLDEIPFVFIKTKTALDNGIDRIKNMFDFYRNILKIHNDISKEVEKPEIIYASSVHPLTLIAGLKLAKKYKIACISEIRDLWPEAIFSFGKLKEKSILGRILTKGEKWIYIKSSAIIFTKEGDIDYLKEKKWLTNQGGGISEDKIFYINNGIDLSEFKKNTELKKYEEYIFDENIFYVTYIGSIRPVNNVKKIVDAAYLLKTNSKIKFLIFGIGSEKDMLEEYSKELGLDNIHFIGQVDKQYVPYILSKSSVNLLNYSESLYNWTRGNSSNKLFEYMAAGKPIISSVKMGYSPIERNNIGLELEESSPENYVAAILKIKSLNLEEKSRIEINALSAVKEYDFKKQTERLIKVINYASKNK
ncbi:glycosyltransferase family 4 protein [Enterococcus sp. LJL128]